MDRRSIFGTMLVAGAGLAAAARITRAEAGSDAAPATPKVVYHLSEIDRVTFVLGNIGNHFDGMGGADKVKIALVIHGAPLMSFRRTTQNDTLRATVARLQGLGLDLFACANTMKGMNLTLDQLLPGFAAADRGGVVKLAELQSQGWAYLRP